MAKNEEKYSNKSKEKTSEKPKGDKKSKEKTSEKPKGDKKSKEKKLEKSKADKKVDEAAKNKARKEQEEKQKELRRLEAAFQVSKEVKAQKEQARREKLVHLKKIATKRKEKLHKTPQAESLEPKTPQAESLREQGSELELTGAMLFDSLIERIGDRMEDFDPASIFQKIGVMAKAKGYSGPFVIGKFEYIVPDESWGPKKKPGKGKVGYWKKYKNAGFKDTRWTPFLRSKRVKEGNLKHRVAAYGYD